MQVRWTEASQGLCLKRCNDRMVLKLTVACGKILCNFVWLHTIATHISNSREV